MTSTSPCKLIPALVFGVFGLAWQSCTPPPPQEGDADGISDIATQEDTASPSDGIDPMDVELPSDGASAVDSELTPMDAESDQADAPRPDTDTGVTIEGVVQKGPFVGSATVTIASLGEGGAPTGALVETTTTSDRGEFSATIDAAGPARVEAQGLYFDELTGALSDQPLVLRALVEAGADAPANVNVFTHLALGRARTLIDAGLSLKDAVAQAEAELRAALGVGVPSYDPGIPGAAMELFGGEESAGAWLLAVGATLLQAAELRGGGASDTPLADLLAAIGEDFAADGLLSDEHRELIDAARWALDPALIEAHLGERLAEIGGGGQVPDLGSVRDLDRDGAPAATDCAPFDPARWDGREDLDGDGVSAALCGGGDCDDRCGSCQPGGARACGEARDHDCDGVIDELQGCATGVTGAPAVIVAGAEPALVTGTDELLVVGPTLYQAGAAGLELWDPSTAQALEGVQGLPPLLGFAARGPFAYALAAGGISVLDRSDGAAPVVTGSAASGRLWETLDGAERWRAGAARLFAVGERLVLVGRDVVIWDTSDPERPLAVGGLFDLFASDDLAVGYVAGDLAVVGGGSRLEIVDLSAPSAPALAATVALDGALPGLVGGGGTSPIVGLTIVGDLAYIVGAHLVAVVSIADPSAPLVLQVGWTSPGLEPSLPGLSVDAPLEDIAVVGGEVYLLSGAGVHILDAASLRAGGDVTPRALGAWPHSGPARLSVQSGVAWIASADGLTAIDLDYAGAGTCGDGARDAGEECDRDDFGPSGDGCAAWGFPESDARVACTDACAVDMSACMAAPSCGDGSRNTADEACDGEDFGPDGDDCASYEMGEGVVLCDELCALDFSGCEPAGCVDDTYEDNDDEGAATDVAAGTYADLRVCSVDHDWYAVEVCAGGTLQVDILFTDERGDIDAKLYLEGERLDSSTSLSDNEHLSWSADVDVSVLIEVYGFGLGDGGNDYALVVTLDGCGGAGGLSCAEVFSCASGCPQGDQGCQQACLDSVSPAASSALWAFIDCQSESGCQDEACIQAACGATLDACFNTCDPACAQGESCVSGQCQALPDAICGDGTRQVGEDCDGDDFGGLPADCAAFGLPGGGSVLCTDACQVDTSPCGGAGGVCGDGVLDPGEACDGGLPADAPGDECADWGRTGAGTVLCGSGCAIDFTNCGASGLSCAEVLACRGACSPGDPSCDQGCLDAVSPSSEPVLRALTDCVEARGCQDDACAGLLCGAELGACVDACDPPCLDGWSCVGGACVAPPDHVCGDGVREGSEECDGPDLGGVSASCASVNPDAAPGASVGCTDACRLDYGPCFANICGNDVLDPGEECDGALPPWSLGERCEDWGVSGHASVTCAGDCTIDSSACRQGDSCSEVVNDCVAHCSPMNPGCYTDCVDGGSATAQPLIRELVNCQLGALCLSLSCVETKCPEEWGACMGACDPPCLNGWECRGGRCVNEATAHCGNGVAEPGEECDGDDFATSSTECAAYGALTGDVTCAGDCTIDLRACAPCPGSCAPGERACQGGDVVVCASAGGACPAFTPLEICGASEVCRELGGEPSCTTCGNGQLDAGEGCDGPWGDTGPPTCAEHGMGSGVVPCNTDTCQLDFSACEGYCAVGCSGDCVRCEWDQVHWVCLPDEASCGGDCGTCRAFSDTEYRCVGDDARCLGDCGACAASGGAFSCVGDDQRCAGGCAGACAPLGAGWSCQSDPCAHGACHGDIDQPTCDCDYGWMGPRCEAQASSCADGPCVHGACVDGAQGYLCACEEGWTGASCAVDEDDCDPDPCAFGSCVDLIGGYQCDCDEGWSGALCDENIDDCGEDLCVHGTCSDLVAGWSCSCEAGWTGELCDQVATSCDPDPCQHGTCGVAGGHYSCACLSGWGGANCDLNLDDCHPNPCAHGACVDLVAGYDCRCEAGWEGADCDEDVDDCAARPCLNGGTCVDELGGFTCYCGEDHIGETCQTPRPLICDGAQAPPGCEPVPDVTIYAARSAQIPVRIHSEHIAVAIRDLDLDLCLAAPAVGEVARQESCDAGATLWELGPEGDLMARGGGVCLIPEGGAESGALLVGGPCGAPGSRGWRYDRGALVYDSGATLAPIFYIGAASGEASAGAPLALYRPAPHDEGPSWEAQPCESSLSVTLRAPGQAQSGFGAPSSNNAHLVPLVGQRSIDCLGWSDPERPHDVLYGARIAPPEDHEGVWTYRVEVDDGVASRSVSFDLRVAEIATSDGAGTIDCVPPDALQPNQVVTWSRVLGDGSVTPLGAGNALTLDDATLAGVAEGEDLELRCVVRDLETGATSTFAHVAHRNEAPTLTPGFLPGTPRIYQGTALSLPFHASDDATPPSQLSFRATATPSACFGGAQSLLQIERTSGARFTRPEAEAACESYGGTLATMELLFYAQESAGAFGAPARSCAWGWTADGGVARPTPQGDTECPCEAGRGTYAYACPYGGASCTLGQGPFEQGARAVCDGTPPAPEVVARSCVDGVGREFGGDAPRYPVPPHTVALERCHTEVGATLLPSIWERAGRREPEGYEPVPAYYHCQHIVGGAVVGACQPEDTDLGLNSYHDNAVASGLSGGYLPGRCVCVPKIEPHRVCEAQQWERPGVCRRACDAYDDATRVETAFCALPELPSDLALRDRGHDALVRWRSPTLSLVATALEGDAVALTLNLRPLPGCASDLSVTAIVSDGDRSTTYPFTVPMTPTCDLAKAPLPRWAEAADADARERADGVLLAPTGELVCDQVVGEGRVPSDAGVSCTFECPAGYELWRPSMAMDYDPATALATFTPDPSNPRAPEDCGGTCEFQDCGDACDSYRPTADPVTAPTLFHQQYDAYASCLEDRDGSPGSYCYTGGAACCAREDVARCEGGAWTVSGEAPTHYCTWADRADGEDGLRCALRYDDRGAGYFAPNALCVKKIEAAPPGPVAAPLPGEEGGCAPFYYGWSLLEDASPAVRDICSNADQGGVGSRDWAWMEYHVDFGAAVHNRQGRVDHLQELLRRDPGLDVNRCELDPACQEDRAYAFAEAYARAALFGVVYNAFDFRFLGEVGGGRYSEETLPSDKPSTLACECTSDDDPVLVHNEWGAAHPDVEPQRDLDFGGQTGFDLGNWLGADELVPYPEALPARGQLETHLIIKNRTVFRYALLTPDSRFSWTSDELEENRRKDIRCPNPDTGLLEPCPGPIQLVYGCKTVTIGVVPVTGCFLLGLSVDFDMDVEPYFSLGAGDRPAEMGVTATPTPSMQLVTEVKAGIGSQEAGVLLWTDLTLLDLALENEVDARLVSQGCAADPPRNPYLRLEGGGDLVLTTLDGSLGVDLCLANTCVRKDLFSWDGVEALRTDLYDWGPVYKCLGAPETCFADGCPPDAAPGDCEDACEEPGRCPECATADDCAPGESCRQGRCSECGADGSCPTGRYCAGARCLERLPGGEPCLGDMSCLSGECAVNPLLPTRPWPICRCADASGCRPGSTCDPALGLCYECSDDGDCGGKAFCDPERHCQQKRPPGAPCGEPDESAGAPKIVPKGAQCASGSCQATSLLTAQCVCESDDDCLDPATRCDVSRQAPICVPRCFVDCECAEGERCNPEGVCVDCVTDSDCDPDEQCFGGRCVECVSQLGCEIGEYCDGLPDLRCRPLQQEGVPCANDTECLSHTCVPMEGAPFIKICAGCAVDADCGPTQYCDANSCVPRKALGLPCSSAGECQSHSCSPQTFTCVCDSDWDCDYPLHCGPISGECRECLSDSHCGAGEYCTSAGCVPKKPDGQGCATGGECHSGRCISWICRECGGDSDCAGGEYCDWLHGRTCEPKGAVGDACELPSACQTGSCGGIPGAPGQCLCRDDGDCAGSSLCSSGRCVECRSWQDCDADEYCTSGKTCAPKRSLGSHCDDPAGFDCQSGACDIVGGQRCVECLGDGHCEGGEFCDVGERRCRARVQVSLPCLRDRMCASGSCSAPSGGVGVCLCDGDGDCPSGRHCHSSGSCVDCLSDAQCGAEQFCSGHKCYDPYPNGHAACLLDSWCQSGHCVGTFCRECADDGDCASDQWCDERDGFRCKADLISNQPGCRRDAMCRSDRCRWSGSFRYCQ